MLCARRMDNATICRGIMYSLEYDVPCVENIVLLLEPE